MDRNFEQKETHDAVCTECGNKCTVPFKPIEGRPIYCRNCYKSKKQSY